MSAREHEVVLRRHIAAPAPLVWALVADTNRWDRAAGLVPGKYAFRELTPGDPATRARVAVARQYGIDVAWVEPPYDWVEGRFVDGHREFLAGPVPRGGFRVELTPDATGTTVEARAWVGSEGVGSALIAAAMKSGFRSALARYLDAIDGVLTRDEVSAEYGWGLEPPAEVARRTLMAGAADPVASGKVTRTREADFAYRVRRFDDAPVAPAVRARIVSHIRTRPDEELSRIRPFELARAWALDRREVLRGFLHAARAGLVDLRWQLNCPTCKVGAETAGSLADVRRSAHCDACNVDFALDFREHIEAVFRVSPSLRAVEETMYCASSPWWRPHVFAQVTLDPGATREFAAPLPPGALLVRTMTGRRRATLDLGAGPPRALALTVTAAGIDARADGGAIAGGEDSAVALVNATDAPVTVAIERTGWSSDVVLGSVIATLPDFLDLFATEAPAAGVELSVSSMTLLFTDLTGSTAMYERLGDARAFAIVQDHFRALAAITARHAGAVVKTMGDAVMASFASPADALRAAIEMVDETARLHGGDGLSVKLGLHEGPCLVVRANDRMDFFGTTVNVAARLQAQAKAGQVVIMRALLAHPDVARTLRERPLPSHEFTARLKGIRDEQRLVALDVAPPADGATVELGRAQVPRAG